MLLLLVGIYAVGGCGKAEKKYRTGIGTIDVAGGAQLPKKVPKPLDVSYIPAEAVFALVADSYQLAEAPNFRLVSDEGIKDMLALDMGIDLLNTEQVILFGGLGKKLGDYYAGTILRYKAPVDLQLFLHARAPDWEMASEGDHKYYRPVGTNTQCVCAVSDKVVLTASEETLKQMLTVAKDAESPLLTTLRKHDDGAAALAVLEMAAIRPQVNAFLLFTKLPAPFDAPPYDGVKQLPKNIDEAVVKFDVTPLTSFDVQLRSPNEDGAIATDTFVANVIDKIGETVDETIAGIDQNDRLASAQAAALQGLFGNIKSLLKHNRDGVNISVQYGGLPVQNQLLSVGPMVFESYKKSWLESQRTRTAENMAKIGAALNEYAAAKGAYPAPAIYSADGKPLLSWRVQILPQLGQQALYDEFHLDEPWDSEHNKKLLLRMPMAYRNPEHPFDGKTQFMLPTGEGTLFAGKDGAKPDSISDGKNKTILAVEVFEGRGVEWTKPEDLKFDRADPTVNLTHLAKPVFIAAFADGATHGVDAKKYPTVLTALFSPAGGEEVPEEVLAK